MRLDELITLRHLEKRLEEGEEKSVEILYRFLFNNIQEFIGGEYSLLTLFPMNFIIGAYKILFLIMIRIQLIIFDNISSFQIKYLQNSFFLLQIQNLIHSRIHNFLPKRTLLFKSTIEHLSTEKLATMALLSSSKF